MKSIKKLFVFSLFLTTSVFGQNHQVIDKIIAQVGDNIILLSDLQNQKTQAFANGETDRGDQDCVLLEEILYQELLVSQAKLDSTIQISDEQVDAEMENRLRVIEKQIGGKEKMEAFYGMSTSEIKDQFREVIRERLMGNDMERKITSDISVTPKEVKEFYNKIPSDSLPFINSKLRFQQIVFYPEITKDDKQAAYDKLLEIREGIVEKGKSFETQARIHSMDPGSAQKGGVIEATRGMMVPAFEAAVFSLKPGEVSDVFETNYGFHIVKLIERKGDDYVCAHILIMPEPSVKEQEKASLLMDSCYNLLRTNAITWDDAVSRFSNDKETMQNRGIITNPITGDQMWSMEDLNQVDQQIYLLTDRMDVGEISQPSLYYNIYDSRQGFRIVRLMDRTNPHKANLNEDYALIQSAAENEKKQKAILSWTQSKIGNAYIKIDDAYKNCLFQNKWVIN